MKYVCSITLFCVLCASSLVGCIGSSLQADAQYRAPENLLEVVSVLRRHIPDDTYRFDPARDFTGRNVYRASLLRLENIERVHADALRAGHMDPVLAFSKARALERLRAFDLAAENYRKVAQYENSPLRQEALEGAAVCDALDEALQFEFFRSAPFSNEASTPFPKTSEQAEGIFAKRSALLEALLSANSSTHYRFVIQEEVEHMDMSRALYYASLRHADPDGNPRALAEYQQLAMKHHNSKNSRRHLIALADLYAEIAREYVDRNAPESLQFDPVSFRELIDAATQIYQNVSSQDGSPEKIEAARKLEELLAFTLRIDRDRFTP